MARGEAAAARMPKPELESGGLAGGEGTGRGIDATYLLMG